MDVYTAKLDMVANRVFLADYLVNDESFFIQTIFDSKEDMILDSINNTRHEYLAVGTISGRLEE